MKRRSRTKWIVGLVIALGLLAIIGFAPLDYAYVPSPANVVNESPARKAPAIDLWGRSISAEEARALRETPDGRKLLSPADGAVLIDDNVLALGRDAFYGETFGNEIFLSDVLGILDGPLTPWSYAKAVLKLGGKGTTNLRVEVAYDAKIGGRQFHKGELVDTGLDVPSGAYTILGMKFQKRDGKLRAGMTCAACHSTVDPVSFHVVHGAPNWDLNTGLMMAMASNSSAFFPHTNVDPLKIKPDKTATVLTADGRHLPLPDPQALEDAVDEALLKWPPGGFDSMIDLEAAPTKLPSSFTNEAWPYSYSGAFSAGPFHGLSVQTNNVHALNSDTTVHAETAPVHFGLDKDQYLAIILRRSPARHLRYDPSFAERASQYLSHWDPTPGQPGLNQLIALPTYPKASLMAPTSLWNSDSGFKVWEKVNAMGAWQNTIIPPPAPIHPDIATLDRGRQVFDRVGCAQCHQGSAFTNHHVLPAELLKTQPLRAKAMAKNEFIATNDTEVYSFDQPVPLPPSPRTIPVPAPALTKEEVNLSMGWAGTKGGFKVPTLVGLSWTAPYLHDGGVAVGSDVKAELGVSGTLKKFIRPDAANSLRALVDRELRERVVRANRKDPDLVAMHVEGIGHEFWVDGKAGYSKEDQAALIDYLLSIQPEH